MSDAPKRLSAERLADMRAVEAERDALARELQQAKRAIEIVEEQRDLLRFDLHEALNLIEDGPEANPEDVARLRAIADGKRPPGWDGGE